ncbi:cbxX protein [Tirmania nivea]|nr:cbxX protein [Tirmania nivea]
MGKNSKAQRKKQRRAQAAAQKLVQAEKPALVVAERNEKDDTKKSEPRAGVEPKLFLPRPSAAEAEWKRQKVVDIASDESSKYEPLDKLMKMTGLEQVKETFLTMLAKAHACEQQGITLEKERFHAIFQGNPGTGKTTVARLYAQFLHSIGKLETETLKFLETSGAKLCYEGADGAEKLIQEILDAGGGVLFVDEAYQLTAPHSSVGGRQALDVLLTEMENHLDKLVVIFVGYRKELEYFFDHNPGLQSRIIYDLNFEDYTDWELWSIMNGMIKDRFGEKLTIEEGIDGLYMRICIRRIGRQRGHKGFGNARTVASNLQWILERQSRRLAQARRNGEKVGTEAYLHLIAEDIIGKEPKSIKDGAAYKTLQKLTGLDSVKGTIERFINLVQINYTRELNEYAPLQFSLNRIMVGNPGSGKTTVAKLYGQMMAEMGFLSNGEIVVKSAADFIGSCLGKSEAQTKRILNNTLGKVLIIDEAYMLYNGSTAKQADKQDQYRAAVIDTLVADVQSVPGDNRCVLMIGYEDKMNDMFLNVNPGLARRFQSDNPFRFEDYDVEHLMEILKHKLEKEELMATDQALNVARAMLARAKMRPSFSNASEVDNILAPAKLNCQSRIKSGNEPAVNPPLQPEDFDSDYLRIDNPKETCGKDLRGKMVEEVVERLEGIQALARCLKLQGRDPRSLVPTNFVFRGNPGTGKTTAARNMGKLFYDIGFLSTAEVVECSATDLIAEYVGQTGPKTQQQLQKGLGKVLVIDEAHRLSQGGGVWNFAAEACNEIVHQISQPKYKGKIIIVLAGDSVGMHDLMKRHTNLAGHFSYVIDFPNIPPKDAIYLLAREVEALGIAAPFLPPEGAYPREENSAEWDRYYSQYTQEFDQLYPIFKLLGIYPSWHNARDIRSLAKRMAAEVFRACGKQSPASASLTLTWEHVVTSLKPVLSEFTQRHCYGFVEEDGGNYNTAVQSLSQLCASQSSQDPPQMADGYASVASDTAIDSQNVTQHEEQISSDRDFNVLGGVNSNRFMCLNASDDDETVVDFQQSESQASLLGSSEDTPAGDPVAEEVASGADAAMNAHFAGDHLHCMSKDINSHTHRPRNSSDIQKPASLHTSVSRHSVGLLSKAKSGVGKISRKVLGGITGQGKTPSPQQRGLDVPLTSGGVRDTSRLRLSRKRSTDKIETQAEAAGACPWGYDWIQKAPGRWECGYGTCVREENPGGKR